MTWIKVTKGGREVSGQAIPPTENMYRFAARFVRQRKIDGDPKPIFWTMVKRPASPVTAEDIYALTMPRGRKGDRRPAEVIKTLSRP